MPAALARRAGRCARKDGARWPDYRGVLGLGGIPDLAFCAAGMAGAVDWEVGRRSVLPKLLRKLGG